MTRKALEKSTLFSFGKPGPFQIIEPETLDLPSDAPRRRYTCSNYETCLNMAAALNWDNFTCRGCSGELNESLLWRAQAESRKDKIVKEICPNLSQNASSLSTTACLKATHASVAEATEPSAEPHFPLQMLRTVGKR